ncbi:Uncharacterized protein LAWI1_G000472 [Lachnellula willkommii]|uniref:Nucleolar pre-ribosomal-associated protein n=1 Tax=Lachnellula willkommii TaxID=215461 RepID=A0A559MMH1_9HELO|nr:Uncharacterized protein LAWI1_G000472 [Lachnellula willkommii]
MAKRGVEDLEDGNQAYLKRQKISNTNVSKPTSSPTEIRSARELRRLLSFDQDSTRSKHGKNGMNLGEICSNTIPAIESFKAFLDPFAVRENDHTHRISILREFFETSQSREEEDKPVTYLPDLMQTWSFAAQSNDELLLSAIPAVLAVLLRTLSSILDLVQHGLGGKTFILSPILRLLNQLAMFDGGEMAKQVFRARDYTLKGLARRIAMLYGYDQPDEELTKAKKTVEGVAHEFLVLACMSPELGALNRQAGFYPRGIDPDDLADFDDDKALLDLGLHMDVPLLKLKLVLTSISKENQVLQTQTSISALESFILVLRSLRGIADAHQVYEFLDDCISRCAAKPIKYIFALEEINSRVHDAGHKLSPFSLLTLVIAEQWPFLVKSASDTALQEVARFVASYLATLLKIKEDKKIIKDVIQRLAAALPEDSAVRSTIEGTRNLVDIITVPERKSKQFEETEQNSNKSNVTFESDDVALTANMLEDTDIRAADSSSLVKWVNKDVEEVIEGGHAAALVMLLSSELLGVRKEAVTNISKFAAKLKDSVFEEKDQVWLLLSEVVETAKKSIDQEALPTVISAFASHSIPVLSDPLHRLYPKINNFLSQGPTWEADKIPLMYKILDEPPSFDDAYYQETNWLLTYLLAGLRSPADMAIYRKRRVFEKLLSIWNNTYLAPGVRDKILRLLFRATTIEGGSTTLITRFSAMTWIEAQVALGTGMSLKALMERILESSDKQRVRKWSKGGNVGVVKADIMKF